MELLIFIMICYSIIPRCLSASRRRRVARGDIPQAGRALSKNWPFRCHAIDFWTLPTTCLILTGQQRPRQYRFRDVHSLCYTTQTCKPSPHYRNEEKSRVYIGALNRELVLYPLHEFICVINYLTAQFGRKRPKNNIITQHPQYYCIGAQQKKGASTETPL